MRINLLKAKIIECGYSTSELLAKLEEKEVSISKAAWYRKINGASEFTRPEIQAIIELLGIGSEEVSSIFFNRQS